MRLRARRYHIVRYASCTEHPVAGSCGRSLAESHGGGQIGQASGERVNGGHAKSKQQHDKREETTMQAVRVRFARCAARHHRLAQKPISGVFVPFKVPFYHESGAQLLLRTRFRKRQYGVAE